LDIMLVGPTGVNVVIMSDAGSTTRPLSNVTLRFRDSAPGPLPDESQIDSGDYQPTNYGGGDFPFSGSPSDNATTLSAYNGTIANGDWKLYVVDDTASARGGVISSWQLSIRTRPRLLDIPTQVTQEDTQKRFTVQYGAPQPGVNNTVSIQNISVVSGQRYRRNSHRYDQHHEW